MLMINNGNKKLFVIFYLRRNLITKDWTNFRLVYGGMLKNSKIQLVFYQQFSKELKDEAKSQTQKTLITKNSCYLRKSSPNFGDILM